MSDKPQQSGFEELNRPGLSGNVRGAFWMIASAFAFTVYLILAKQLSGQHDPGFLAFWRAAIALLITAPLFLRDGFGILKTDNFRLIGLRSLLGTLGFIFSLYAISDQFGLPLSQFNALSFSRPLFISILAFFLLRETVGLYRWGAIVAGFIGVLVMIWPGLTGAEPMNFGSVLALLSAFSFAGAIILVKKLTATHKPMTLLIWANLLSAILLLPFAIWKASMPGPEDAALILAMALAGLAGQYCYITAMSMGDASFLSSMDYLRLPIAALADWLIFKLLPGLSVWLGAGIIIAATLFITIREARLGRKRGPKAPGAP